jgi:hypothetical protein
VALYSAYTKDIHKHLRYRATWLPGTPVALGDVGILDKGVLVPQTSLPRLGVDFEVQTDTVPDGTLDYQSANEVSIAIKAAGELNKRFNALAEADAGALVEFTDADSVLLQLRGVRVERVADQAALRRALLDAVVAADDQRRWDRDWVVVTDVVTAASATILIAGGRGSRIELKAAASVAPTSLADVDAGLTTVSESQVSTKIVAQNGLTPLYRGMRVRRNFWWLYDEVVTATGELPEADEVFADADPEEDSADED